MKKAFTLVELIVVITILAILGTISFISLQNYSKEARDSKRITDVRSLLTRLNLEQTTSGLGYKELLITTTPHNVEIDGKTNPDAYQGAVNFELLRESQKNFQDPESKGDYDFATAKGTAEYNGKDQAYNFIQGRYWNEKNNEQMLLGNYYKYQPTDSENLFKDTLTGPNISTNTPPITPSGSCTGTKPIDNGHIEYNEGNPSSDTPWTQASSGDCTYQCKDGYTGSDCNTLLSGVFPDGDDLIVNDGTNSITIRDRNEGATEVYNGTEKAEVRGNYYQWGNKYGFANSGTITTSSTLVDAGSNGASTYNSSTFIMQPDWSSTKNDNLWGNTTNTNVARIGPCPSGYHVPSKEEWLKLVTIWFKSKGQTCAPVEGSPCSWTGTATLANFQSELKIPLAGNRNWGDESVYDQGSYGYYWSSSPSGTNPTYASLMYFDSSLVFPQTNGTRAFGFSLRCFKN